MAYNYSDFISSESSITFLISKGASLDVSGASVEADDDKDSTKDASLDVSGASVEADDDKDSTEGISSNF
jgi:hypothetical protein